MPLSEISAEALFNKFIKLKKILNLLAKHLNILYLVLQSVVAPYLCHALALTVIAEAEAGKWEPKENPDES